MGLNGKHTMRSEYVLMYENYPVQNDQTNCGYFVILFVYLYVTGFIFSEPIKVHPIMKNLSEFDMHAFKYILIYMMSHSIKKK